MKKAMLNLIVIPLMILGCSGSYDKQISDNSSRFENQKQIQASTVNQPEQEEVEVKETQSQTDSKSDSNQKTYVVKLNDDTFKSKIYDYTAGGEFVLKNNRPCIIDFYADWCRPCKMIAPIMDKLSVEYKGKIDFYKVNTDEQRAISAAFGISGIPSLLFCPKGVQPQMASGFIDEENLRKIINEFLLAKKN